MTHAPRTTHGSRRSPIPPPAAAERLALPLNRTTLTLLGHIRGHGQIARSEVAVLMGLTRAGLAKVANPLLDAGIIRAVEERDENVALGRGRPSQVLAFGDNAPKGLGISVGLHIDLAVVDYGNRILAEKRLANRFQSAGAREDVLVEELVRECRKLLAHVSVGTLAGVGLVVSGDMTEDGQWIARANDFASAKQANRLVSRLRELFPCPTHLANDAWVSVLAERWLAKELPTRPTLAFVTNRLGIGLVIEGRLYHGPAQWSRWLGHVQADPNGAPCSCGRRGCLAASSWIGGVLDHLTGFVYGTRPPIPINEVEKEWEDVMARYRSGDSVVVELMRSAYDNLGRVLRNLAEIFAFDAIILDSWAGERGGEGVSRVRAVIQEGAGSILQHHPLPVIRLPVLGDRQMAVGAVLYAFDRCAEAHGHARPHARRRPALREGHA